MLRLGKHRLRVRSAWVASWIALVLPLSAVAQVDVSVVTLPSASVVDESTTLPASQSLFARGDTFYLEVWAQTTAANGFASLGVDLTFDAARLTAGAITHSSILGIFTHGVVDNVTGTINDLSGAHAPATPPCSDTVGTAPKWVRLASIAMVADAVGSAAIASLDSGSAIWVNSICGSLTPPTAVYGTTAITITECGNGILETGEACDDGNVLPGDCCGATCLFEATGSTCGDQTNTACDNPDTCDGAGICLVNHEVNGTVVDDTCGVGFCQTTNTPGVCAAGAATACVAGTPLSADDATCNGIDDNCSGTADENYVANNACGVGFCQTTNAPSTCVAGVETLCQPGSPLTPDDATCDGVDDNCDGLTDNNYVPPTTTCGLGVCGANGLLTCVAGTTVDTCAPGAPTGADADCNGIDENCSGVADEGYVSDATCGIGACLTSNTPSTCVAGAETLCQAGTPAASDTTCDAIDDDCNGAADDGYVTDATCGVGACLTGNTPSTCVAGAETLCQAGTPAASDTGCDGIDNDCNGNADDGYVADASCGVGACLTGNTPSTCIAGAETLCQAGTPAANDTSCDGIDDDCNGTADDGYVADASCGVGACLTGNTPSTCIAGAETLCQAGTPAANDTSCDGIDDDCNGSADDGYVADASCGVGACQTGNTPSTCVAGAETLCQAGTPAASDTTCDGIDDDCNGNADDGYVTDSSCGVGACLTSNIPSTCLAGMETLCQPGTPAADDVTCDNVDDDCDGFTDNGYVAPATTCGVGACGSAGLLECLAGGVTNDTCTPGLPTAEVCDGADNDCNGTIDDEPAASASCDDALFCTGTEACVSGLCQAAPVCGDSCESCNETTDTCDWCVFDENQNGTIDGLDFAFFSGCFGLCYAPTDACAAANYDGDPNNCVGGGDFAAFSGCFTLACGSCPLCFPGGGGGSPGGPASEAPLSAVVELVAVNSPTADGYALTLPTSDSRIKSKDFYVELWAHRSVLSPDGLASVYVDVRFDPSNLRVDEILSDQAFATLATGSIDTVGGMVRDVGGCAPLGNGSMGVDEWVRVASLHVFAIGSGRTNVVLFPSAPPFGLSIFGRFGDLGVNQVNYGQITLQLGNADGGHANLKSRGRNRPRR